MRCARSELLNQVLAIVVLAATFFVAMGLLTAYAAYAQTPHYVTPMGQVLCRIAGWIIYGNLGRGLATLAIVVVGVGAVLGKTSWGLAITVGVGISVIFGAPRISELLGATPFCDF
jgi:type IV secretory pathway VirB2 component (pilin)